ncbi:MAG: hypothetical protein ACPGLV_01915 [Bacteroidia bacterium]
MKRAVFVMVLMVSTLLVSAQFRAVNRLSFESNVGFSLVHGDIAPSGVNVSMQLGAGYALLRSMSICGSVNYASLSASDRYERNFAGTIVGFQFDYEINIPQLLTDYPMSFPVSPYVRFGAGYDIARITSLSYGNVGGVYPDPVGEVTSQSHGSLTVPTTIGAYFRLNSYADINLKINYVYADSDMMDGHNPLVVGNQYKDSYSMIMVGVRMKSWDRRRPHITGR